MKKIIISLIIVLFTVINISAFSLWTESEFKGVITGASADKDKGNSDKIKPAVSLKLDVEENLTEKIKLEVNDKLLYSKRNNSWINSFVNNTLSSALSYNNSNLYVNTAFSYKVSDKDNSRFIQIPGNDDLYKQKNNFNSAFSIEYSVGKIEIESYTKYRNIAYLSQSDEAIDDSDIFLRDKCYLKLNEQIKLSALYFHKNDLNDESYFDLTQLGTGIEFYQKFNLFNMIRLNFDYLKNNSDAINPEREHNFISTIRYTKRIGNNLSGFISFINRTSYNTDESEFYRIANVLRLQAKYSYLTDSFADSYVTGGLKISPENKASTFLLGFNQRLYRNLFLQNNNSINNELFYKSEIGLEFYRNSKQSLWFKYQYFDFRNDYTENDFVFGITAVL